MALIHALMQLKNQGLVESFSFFDAHEEKANVILPNGKEIIVFMAKDFYILTYMGIEKAWELSPTPSYIVYNQWDRVTSLAKERANSQNIRLISFVEFREVVEKAVRA